MQESGHISIYLSHYFFLFESFLLRKGKNLNKTRASCLWNVILNPHQPFSSGNGGVVVSAPQPQTFRWGKQLDAVDADDTSVMRMSRVSVIIQRTHTLTLRDTHFHDSVISELWLIKQSRKIKETWALISSCTRLKAGEAKRLRAAFQSFVVFCLFLLFVRFMLFCCCFGFSECCVRQLGWA